MEPTFGDSASTLTRSCRLLLLGLAFIALLLPWRVGFEQPQAGGGTLDSMRGEGVSSFYCTLGSQAFYEGLWIPLGSTTLQRVCRFRNVCLVKGRLTYYANASIEAATPAAARLGAFNSSLLFGDKLSLISTGTYSPDIAFALPPHNVEWAPRGDGYLLGSLGYAYNYAHMLLNTVMPAYGAALLFGYDLARLQLILLNSCDTLSFFGVPSTDAWRTEMCRKNMDNWVQPFFSLPVRHAEDSGDVCFHELIAGHEATFSIGPFPSRGEVIRAMRRHLYTTLGLAPDPPHPTHYSVLVMVKVFQSAAVEFPTLCGDLKALAATLRPPPSIKCITPATMTSEEQVRALQRTSLIIVEHGSTAHVSYFALPGSSLIQIVPDIPSDTYKEAQFLLFNVDVQAWYLPFSQLPVDGANMMRLALRRTGENWGLPPTY